MLGHVARLAPLDCYCTHAHAILHNLLGPLLRTGFCLKACSHRGIMLQILLVIRILPIQRHP